jgi:hypothetical protein
MRVALFTLVFCFVREQTTFGNQCGDVDLESNSLIVRFFLLIAIRLQNMSIATASWQVISVHKRPDAKDEEHVILNDIMVGQLAGEIRMACEPVYATLNAGRACYSADCWRCHGTTIAISQRSTVRALFHSRRI